MALAASLQIVAGRRRPVYMPISVRLGRAGVVAGDVSAIDLEDGGGVAGERDMGGDLLSHWDALCFDEVDRLVRH